MTFAGGRAASPRPSLTLAGRLRRFHRAARGTGTVALLVTLVAGACTPEPADAPPTNTATVASGWQQVTLPAAKLSALTAAQQQLLVSGRIGGPPGSPYLSVVGADGTAEPVRLQARSPYAGVADLVSVGSAGSRVVGVGAAHGGAHANVRWTVWSGSVAGGLVEQPQVFETFGGPDAGGLLDAVYPRSGPVLVGSWASASGGQEAAVWLPRKARWQRQESAGTALANTAEQQVAPRVATAAGDSVVVAGSVIRVATGVRQVAALWTWPTRSAPWSVLDLPDAGGRSEAQAASCTGAECWIAGQVDGRAAAWRVSATGTGAARIQLASELTPDGSQARIVQVAGQPALLVSAGSATHLLLRHGASWRSSPMPPGDVVDAAAVGARLYVILRAGETRLWLRDLREPAGR